MMFEYSHKYRVFLNPNKFVFGVTIGKIIGYIISQRGIEVYPNKIKAIVDMPPHKNLHQL